MKKSILVFVSLISLAFGQARVDPSTYAIQKAAPGVTPVLAKVMNNAVPVAGMYTVTIVNFDPILGTKSTTTVTVNINDLMAQSAALQNQLNQLNALIADLQAVK